MRWIADGETPLWYSPAVELSMNLGNNQQYEIIHM